MKTQKYIPRLCNECGADCKEVIINKKDMFECTNKKCQHQQS